MTHKTIQSSIEHIPFTYQDEEYIVVCQVVLDEIPYWQSSKGRNETAFFVNILGVQRGQGPRLTKPPTDLLQAAKDAADAYSDRVNRE